MCGLMILKQMNNLSDQSVVEMWVENPYWQIFCGMREFQFKFPCTSSELTYFRKRLGEAGVEKMFAVSVSLFSKKARAKKVLISDGERQ
jgi:IS5 family transposase